MARTSFSRAITRRRFLQTLAHGTLAHGALAGAALAGWACGRSGLPGGRPNLLLLVTDDQRADTLGCMGSPVAHTPRIDALARDGVVFDNAFVTTSVCPSSRASIFTGQYTRRHGVRDFRTSLSPVALADSYPLRLREAGYRTGFLGKWGVGRLPPAGAFDVFDGFEGQGRYYHEVDGRARHLTELLASDAVDFLERQPSDRPFCLSVSFKAPHGPWSEHDESIPDPYAGVEMPLPPTASLELASQTFPFLRESLAGERGPAWLEDPAWLRDRVHRYYRMIAGVDMAVGRIRDALEREGLDASTVVVFTSDNGLMLGDHGLVGKWVMYEPSIRVPLVVADPRLPASLRGRRIEEMVLNIDLAPTLLDLAGLPPAPRMQGRSFLPLLEGDHAGWRQDWLYEHDFHPPGAYLPTIEGVRTPDWKYVRYLDARSDREALYDLRDDPDELRNVIDDPGSRAVADRLRERWRLLRAEAA